jgi:hypothetical protein
MHQRIVYRQFSSHLLSHVPIRTSVILCYTLLIYVITHK